jgi:hypothetical protein
MVFRRKPNKRHRRKGSLRRTTSPRVTVAACTLTRISFASGAGLGTSARSSRSADPDLLNKTALIVPVSRVPVSSASCSPESTPRAAVPFPVSTRTRSRMPALQTEIRTLTAPFPVGGLDSNQRATDLSPVPGKALTAVSQPAGQEHPQASQLPCVRTVCMRRAASAACKAGRSPRTPEGKRRIAAIVPPTEQSLLPWPGEDDRVSQRSLRGAEGLRLAVPITAGLVVVKVSMRLKREAGTTP